MLELHMKRLKLIVGDLIDGFLFTPGSDLPGEFFNLCFPLFLEIIEGVSTVLIRERAEYVIKQIGSSHLISTY